MDRVFSEIDVTVAISRFVKLNDEDDCTVQPAVVTATGAEPALP